MSEDDILEATLPEFPENEKETPAGFSHAGHVAHVNLRLQYLPYKHLIGQILIDKNPNIRTVINKTEDVGTESVYRTFPYEVLAGPDDMNVTLSESDCVFEFNFAKVYWNSRLNSEHRRLVEKFKEGETVCDVMAGVGPFAVPAGKKNVFVWANDLNPDSFEAPGIRHPEKQGQSIRERIMHRREKVHTVDDGSLAEEQAESSYSTKTEARYDPAHGSRHTRTSRVRPLCHEPSPPPPSSSWMLSKGFMAVDGTNFSHMAIDGFR